MKNRNGQMPLCHESLRLLTFVAQQQQQQHHSQDHLLLLRQAANNQINAPPSSELLANQNTRISIKNLVDKENDEDKEISNPQFAALSHKSNDDNNDNYLVNMLRVVSPSSSELINEKGQRLRYICNVCGKGFRRSNYLRSHQDTHTTETPYACPIGNCS
ncbi:hypothetical protein HK100_006586 [Physocladia obscura]|uniref:C2H2-type domain-containing protein n=1 Tax=Physocladia obscura TaxID=109957 RepID=A0AAD5SSD2_9FUNG|nr:hypothetical protein HK100_006586 [Physocladia obscura]